MREEYWGKTFEGNECVKLENKVESDCTELSYLPGTKYHIDALKKFNNLRKQVFGTELGVTWHQKFKPIFQRYKRVGSE